MCKCLVCEGLVDVCTSIKSIKVINARAVVASMQILLFLKIYSLVGNIKIILGSISCNMFKMV